MGEALAVLGMRLGAGFILLVLLTLVLAGFLVYRVGLEGFGLFSPRPDSIHPKPVVELFLGHEGELTAVHDNTSLDKPLPESFKLIVKLSNNSSEPSMRGDFAAGVFLALKGAEVKDCRLHGFTNVIGVSENGSIGSPINSSMLELFAEKLGPWQSIEAELYLLRDKGSSCVQIAYRGWIMDEDDLVLEPISKAREHYIARYPPEGYRDNPPDSRWAGKDFLKYKVYQATICSP